MRLVFVLHLVLTFVYSLLVVHSPLVRNCIKNGTVEPSQYDKAVVFFHLDSKSHYPLPENILDQTKSVQLKSMQQNWLWGRSGYNWATVTKNGTTVKTGDVVSVSGKGRLKIGEINETKKMEICS
ncbi:hypothetical protein Bca52824_066125 [Brassica carinata]|uniref:Uncharacterized protein n=1 Tax=Brassica carinata TaxID=52824 RepID=A0A8X7QND4_BRACI|nr:hypothetical protein Bca52824_066125 [Brassica carinata]